MIPSLSRRGFLSASAFVMAATFTSRFTKAADEKPTAENNSKDPAAKPPKWFDGPIHTTKLQDDLYMLDGAGGNNLVHFDATRLLVIDAGMSFRGDELAATAAKLAPTSTAKILFNTHWHLDHAGGNPSFLKAGYAIVGSTLCRQRMGQTLIHEDMGMTSQPSPEQSRPAITFTDKLKLDTPSPIAITKIAPAHTDTDAVAYFEKYNILHTGDLFFPGVFPVIDRPSPAPSTA